MMHIDIYTLLTPEEFEKLEDDLRDFLEEKKISAKIDNTLTGNTTRTRD